VKKEAFFSFRFLAISPMGKRSAPFSNNIVQKELFILAERELFSDCEYSKLQQILFAKKIFAKRIC